MDTIEWDDDGNFLVPSAAFEDLEPHPKRVRPHWIPEGYKAKLSVVPTKRTPEEWAAIFEPYPTASDGYMLAYRPDEVEGYKAALEKYGFVVIKDVLTPEACDLSVKSFWDDVSRRSKPGFMDPNDPMTWETRNWPSGKKFLLGVPAFTEQAFLNRTSPVLYNIYCNLFGRTDLWTSIDNWGFFRATKNLKWKDEEGNEYAAHHTGHSFMPVFGGQIHFFADSFLRTLVDRDDWRYNLKLHWDYNPWVLAEWQTNKEPAMFQSLVALDDCPLEVGGFMAVPCSHTFMHTWIAERVCPRMNRASMRLPEDDPMQKHMQKVPLRKGEMVIWHSETAHCNFPNYSSKCRVHQFVRCLTATRCQRDKDRYAPDRISHGYRDDPYTDWSLPFLTPLGRKLVAMDPWPEQQTTESPMAIPRVAQQQQDTPMTEQGEVLGTATSFNDYPI